MSVSVRQENGKRSGEEDLGQEKMLHTPVALPQFE